jgi:murein DD-endopeptidase MepM/ murein hydrolase activator NlpD
MMIFKNEKIAFGNFQIKFLETVLTRFNAWVRYLVDGRGGGNLLSCTLRPLFESKRIRVFLGIFLSLAVMFSGFWREPEGYFGEGGEFPRLAEAQDKFDTIPDVEKVVVKLEAGVRVPVEDYIVSRGYFWWHQGVDLAAEEGTKVYAFRGGRVVQVNYWSQSYGNHVILDHEDGYISLYGHLKEGSIKLEVGKKVTTETVVGEVGSTGYSTGPHLHFEILKDGELINPGEIVEL